jgi:hypothetical protein
LIVGFRFQEQKKHAKVLEQNFVVVAFSLLFERDTTNFQVTKVKKHKQFNKQHTLHLNPNPHCLRI